VAVTQSASLRVPLLDLQAQYAPLRHDILEAVTRVCDSQRFILGPEVDALETELAAALEVDQAVSPRAPTRCSWR
jgi:dTDP-4-amino-4,6-dideoxygalactose transaminase